MTAIEKLEEVRKAKVDPLVKELVQKSMVRWKLGALAGEGDPGDIRFGFSISTSPQDEIELKADENGRQLTDADWNQLNADIHAFERNACNILRNNSIQCSPEGHGDDDLAGSAWITTIPDTTGAFMLPSKNALQLLWMWSSGNMNSYDGSIEEFDPNKTLYDGVSELGQSLVDVRIDFFDTEKLKLDDWREVYDHHPHLWGQMNEAKELLDFNTLLGPQIPPGVYVRDIDGVSLFSVRCPGCKRIHGNFRTYNEASGNRQCKYCNRDFVDMVQKANETGNIKPLLKKHDKRKSR